MSHRDLLGKIREQGLIHVGFQHHTPPFAYKAAQQVEPIGYSVDICHRVLRGICVELGLEEIQISPVEVTSSTRQGMLDQGLIDMECGSTSITPARQKNTLFSQPIFYTAHRIAVKNSHAESAAHSKQPLRATGIENSTSHHAILNWPEAPRAIEFFGCSSIHSAFERFQNDPAIEVMVADEVILKSLLLQSGSSDMVLLPMRLKGEPYGFMFHKEEHQFKALVDQQLSRIFQADEFEKLYARWFMNTLPDLNFNLDLPLHTTQPQLRQPGQLGKQS